MPKFIIFSRNQNLFVKEMFFSDVIARLSAFFLKGSINPGEDLLAFGTQKPENFNDKNRIYLAFWCVFKDIEHNFHEFVCFKKFFFWVCLFPTISKFHKWPSKTSKFGKKSKILPKSSKNNKCWFLWQFLRQIFRYDPKVHCLWIFWS